MERLESFARGVLAVGVAGCFTVAAWLLSVVALVLPGRDPGRIPLWSAVLVGFALAGALGAWHLRDPRRAGTRRGLGLAAPLFLLAGGVGAWSQVARASRGGEFEGYVVLMGVGLVAYAGAALLHLAATRRLSAPASA